MGTERPLFLVLGAARYRENSDRTRINETPSATFPLSKNLNDSIDKKMASLGEDLLGIVNKLQDLVFNTIGNDSLDLPQIVSTLDSVALITDILIYFRLWLARSPLVNHQFSRISSVETSCLVGVVSSLEDPSFCNLSMSQVMTTPWKAMRCTSPILQQVWLHSQNGPNSTISPIVDSQTSKT